jgi:hypothetical protein
MLSERLLLEYFLTHYAAKIKCLKVFKSLTGSDESIQLS